jgi:beta-1,4-mannosyl-glycoprotein beta-1,4-N-acetylglucosaminyltransferase
MIYDCFLFLNELELLELRLHELAGVVDRFVIAEATRTFSGKPKPLSYQENKDAFKAFHDKIIHVVVEDPPGHLDHCEFPDFQRISIARGLAGCRPDDVVMLSDVDEIPRADVVRETAKNLPFATGAFANAWHRLLIQPSFVWTFRNWFKKRHPFVTVFDQRLHGFFLNCLWGDSPHWFGTRMIHFRDLSNFRDLRRWNGRLIPNSGWHFSYMGGVDRIQNKIGAYSHLELNTPEFNNREKLEAALKEGRNVITPNRPLRVTPIDESYPKYVRENLSKFEHWLRKVE